MNHLVSEQSNPKVSQEEKGERRKEKGERKEEGGRKKKEGGAGGTPAISGPPKGQTKANPNIQKRDHVTELTNKGSN